MFDTMKTLNQERKQSMNNVWRVRASARAFVFIFSLAVRRRLIKTKLKTHIQMTENRTMGKIDFSF